jgi:hypothetical protein
MEFGPVGMKEFVVDHPWCGESAFVMFFVLDRLFSHRGVGLDLHCNGTISGFGMSDTLRDVSIILGVLNSYERV